MSNPSIKNVLSEAEKELTNKELLYIILKSRLENRGEAIKNVPREEIMSELNINKSVFLSCQKHLKELNLIE